MAPGWTHLRPRAAVPGDVWKITARLNQTTKELETRQTNNQTQSKEGAPGY